MIICDFSGRHAVVTGARDGMGEAIARNPSASGATVAAIDIKLRRDRRSDLLERAAREDTPPHVVADRMAQEIVRKARA